MSHYTTLDIESVISFIKEKSNSNINDWIEYHRTTISDEEIKLFENIVFAKIVFNINNIDHLMYLFKSNNNDISKNFITKFVGDKPYYNFYPGDYYGYYYSLISLDEDLFNLNNWNDFTKFKDVKGIKILENDMNVTLMFDYSDSESYDEYLYEPYHRYMDYMKKENYYFWDSVQIFIKDINSFKFENISELFNKK